MIRKLIVPAALLALSACAGGPTEPAARTGALRANPAFGSGAGVLSPTDETAGSGGYIGSDGRTETGDATLASSGFMGGGYRTEPPADTGEDGSSIIGTGAVAAEADSPTMGSGN